jgi:hypothetical protein
MAFRKFPNSDRVIGDLPRKHEESRGGLNLVAIDVNNWNGTRNEDDQEDQEQ